MPSLSIAMLLCVPAMQAQDATPSAPVEVPHEREDLFGSEACVVGDVDGDGIADVLVGAPLAYHAGPWTGAAFLLSGRDGTALRVLRGNCDHDWFGSVLAGGGEIDGDGVPDFAIAAPRLEPGRGYVELRAGKSGEIVLTLRPDASGRQFGRALAFVPDLNGDGRSDIAVSWFAARKDDAYVSFDESPCSVRIFSSRDGAVLRTIECHGGSLGMGRSLSLAPDLDGDQVADMIVGSARQSPTRPSALTAFGTRDGRELFSLECQTAGRSFGDELAFADIDADGARDILVGELSDAADAPPEYVAAYSGKDRSLLRRASSDKARFGYRICGVGDVNRDGCEDYAVACEGWLAVGRTWLLSGKDGAELFDWKEESGVCDPHIGVSMAAPGDVDGDGVPDVFLGVVNQAAPGCPGEGRMLSGRTGELIWAQTKAAALAGKVASPRAPK